MSSFFGRSRQPERYVAYFFIAPALILLLTFRVIPLISGFGLSLSDWNGIAEPVWVGFQNYVELFTTDLVFRATMQNVGVVLLTLPIWVLLPLLLAVMIHFGVPGGKFFRVAYFLPLVLSSIIIGSMFSVLLRFDGVLNEFLAAFGFKPADWLGGSNTALLSVVSVAIWAHFGMSILIYLAGLATLPSEVIEAAKIDGANLWQIITLIIAPIMIPIVQFVTVICTIEILTSMFGLIFVMTGGGPGTSTYMPEFLIWQQQGESNRLGYAAAISMVLFVFVGILGIIQLKVLKRDAS
jgi:multiple sugar transport system permease protein